MKSPKVKHDAAIEAEVSRANAARPIVSRGASRPHCNTCFGGLSVVDNDTVKCRECGFMFELLTVDGVAVRVVVS